MNAHMVRRAYPELIGRVSHARIQKAWREVNAWLSRGQATLATCTRARRRVRQHAGECPVLCIIRINNTIHLYYMCNLPRPSEFCFWLSASLVGRACRPRCEGRAAPRCSTASTQPHARLQVEMCQHCSPLNGPTHTHSRVRRCGGRQPASADSSAPRRTGRAPPDGTRTRIRIRIHACMRMRHACSAAVPINTK
jgi:hypothetical protein